MKRYLNKIDETFNNYADEIDESYMIEIPNDGKPYGLVNGVAEDISQSTGYLEKIAKEAKSARTSEVLKKINELDNKRVRALCEPELKDTESGETWLEFYTNQIIDLRKQIAEI